VPGFGLQELSNVRHADFHFERRGDSIQRLDTLACQVLAMLMQINKAGSDYQTAGANDAPAAQRLGRDANNLAIANANVAHCIHTRFWIHDPAAFEHKIVLLCGHVAG
jgi:hypothetical protein